MGHSNNNFNKKDKTMYLKDITEVAKQPTIWASIAPFLNPVTIIPAIAIGVMGVTAYTIIKRVNKLKAEKEKLIEDNEILEIEFNDYIESVEYEEIKEEEIEPFEPLINGTSTVNSTVEPTVNERLNPTVSNDLTNGSLKGQSTIENMSDEDLNKELIRQAMSELGKRSAKSRADKKIKL